MQRIEDFKILTVIIDIYSIKVTFHSLNRSPLKTDRKIRFHYFLSLHRDVGMLKNCDKTQYSILHDPSVEFHVIINNIHAEKH